MNIGIFFTIPTQLVKYFNADTFVDENVDRKYFVKNCGTIITTNGNIWRYIIGERPTHGVRLDKAWVSNLVSKDFLDEVIYPCFSKEPEINYFYEEKLSVNKKGKTL